MHIDTFTGTVFNNNNIIYFVVFFAKKYRVYILITRTLLWTTSITGLKEPRGAVTRLVFTPHTIANDKQPITKLHLKGGNQ